MRARMSQDLFRRKKAEKKFVGRKLLQLRLLFSKKVSIFTGAGSFIKIRERCMWSGRARGVFCRYRLSRRELRSFAQKGLVSGVQRLSWLIKVLVFASFTLMTELGRRVRFKI